MAELTENQSYVILKREEFDSMEASLRKLEALENAGVDNWEGYDHAIASLADDS